MQQLKNVGMADVTRVFLAPSRTDPMAAVEPAPGVGVANTISLKSLSRILRRRIGWLLFAMLLGLAAALAVVASSVPRYVATAQIIIDPRGLKVLDTEVQPSAQSADAVTNLAESEMRVLKATDLLERVVDKLGLAEDPEFNDTRTSAVGEVIGRIKGLLVPARETPRPDPRARAVGTLSDRLAVRRIERSFVVEVTMTSENAAKSATIANTVVDTYIAHSAETQAELARNSSAAIDGNLQTMQSRVRAAEDAVERFKAANKLVNAGGRLVSDQQLGELNSQLGRARTQVAEAQARVDGLSKLGRAGGANAGAGLESVESQTLAALRLQLAEVKRRYASLENKLGPRHPELVDLRREVQEAQSNVTAEIDRLAQAARSDLERAREAERLFKRDLDAQSRTATAASGAFVQLRELERNAEASRSVYSAALVRSRQLQEQALLNSTNIRKVAPATAPDRKANPPAPLVLALGLIVGLLTGAAGLTLHDLAAGKVRTRDDLERSSGLPDLATVPVASRALHPGSANLYRTDARPWHEMLDRLGIGRPGAVLSADRDDMSGLVALDLARAAAGIGAKVLLIDAGVGARQLTRFLGLDDAAGLGACASGSIALADAVWPIREDGITFLCADASAANDLRRIDGPGLPGIVRDALADYSLVVLDLGSAPRESLPLVASATEAGILVVEKERGSRSAVQAALARCQNARLPLAGVVLAEPVAPKGRGA